jgi:hypothetical protein
MIVDLFLEEKKFISVKRASEETGYTSDYIGQLCRHGKIPAKLVGRTWFVDFESLLNHKNNPNSRALKKIGVHDSQELKIVSPAVVREEDSLDFESELPQILPELLPKSGVQKILIKSRPVHSRPLVVVLTTVVALFVVSNTTFLWLNYLLPRQAEIVDRQIVALYDSGISFVSSFGSKIHLALASADLVEGSSSEPDQSVQTQGVVVFPDTNNMSAKKRVVNQVFSDDTEVIFDQSGESGVIRPVFRPGSDSSDYAFVMVPVKTTKPTSTSQQ